MQIIGLILVALVITYGFADREMGELSAFDLRALVVVLGGSIAAIFIGSSAKTAWRTLLCMRELVPFAGVLAPGTKQIEEERQRLTSLWREGRRAQAVEMAQNSALEPIRKMLELMIARAPVETTDTVFLELNHELLERWQPAATNWEFLARLGPTFGMVGTVAGMIQLFRHMGEESLNIGGAMSLALLTTLYGLAIGGGVAGPIGHYLQSLLDDRIGALERCRQSVVEMVGLSGGRGGNGAGV